MADPEKKNKAKFNDDNACFVIMPISDPDGYDSGHFQHVYDNIIKPSVITSGFVPHRADEVQQTNFIHLDILKKLIEAPLAICDLSSRNPNVLFELGIRQAFDKPVVLIQEKGTPKIFDISPFRIYDYSKEMKYHEVINSQQQLVEIIKSTIQSANESGNVNSIVRLMALSSPASIPKLDGEGKETLVLDLIQSQLKDLTRLVQSNNSDKSHSNRINSSIFDSDYEINETDKKQLNKYASTFQLINLSSDSNQKKIDQLTELENKVFNLKIPRTSSLESLQQNILLNRINLEIQNLSNKN